MASPSSTKTLNTALLKIPPHSVEAEQAVIGGLLIDNDAWDQVVERITETDFYRHEHRILFRAMTELMLQSMPLDIVTVTEALERSQELDMVGGIAYVAELAKNTPSAANVSAYANIVRERSILRQLIDVGGKISESAFQAGSKTALEVLDEAERRVFSIAEQESGRAGHQGPQIISEVLARTIDRIDTLFHSKSSMTGLGTGFGDFDRMTSGLQAADLVIVAGRPSMGKTTFAMNIAEHIAMTDGVVLVFSMEMPAESLAMRMLSSLGRIEQQRIRSGQLHDHDWTKLTSAISMMSSKKLLLDDTGSLSPFEIRARARRIAREYNGKLSLIVIDYLQLMRLPGHYEHRAAEISEISRALKALAKELNIPVMVLSQLNRGLEQRPEKRPVMSDLRESGAIEQDADLIVFVYRDEVYNKESPDKGTAEIIIGKQRNGPTGTVRLNFVGHFSRFDNFTAEKQEVYSV
jgi:replicative DNA helicase